MTAPTRPGEAPPTADEGMSRKEKDEMADQIEELEGPDPRQVPADEEKLPRDPGVSHS